MGVSHNTVARSSAAKVLAPVRGGRTAYIPPPGGPGGEGWRGLLVLHLRRDAGRMQSEALATMKQIMPQLVGNRKGAQINGQIWAQAERASHFWALPEPQLQARICAAKHDAIARISPLELELPTQLSTRSCAFFAARQRSLRLTAHLKHLPARAGQLPRG